MDSDGLPGPPSRVRPGPSLRSSAVKRDSLMAELERDPQHSTAKRQQRTQAFTSQLAHASLERQLASLTTTKNELEKKLREKDSMIDRLEKDRRWLSERETEEREEKERERLEWDEAKRKSEHDIRSLRASLTALREEHADLQDAHSSLSRTTSQTIASQKSQIATMTHQTNIQSSELTELKSIAEERSATIQSLQSQLDDIQDLPDAKRGAEEENWTVVREELHRQASYLRTLEGANAKMTMELNSLRERHASVEVLREEKRGLERKVKVLEELRETVVKLEAEVDAGRREREEWASKSADTSLSTPSKTPIALTQSLSALRLTHARLLEDHGATKALLRQREAEITAYEQRESEAQHAAGELQTRVKGLRESLDRSERKCVLAEREVGFLQALVASFTAEETTQERIDGNSTPLLNSIESQRITQLESVLAEYKTTIELLTKEMDAMGGGGGALAALGNGKSRQELAEAAEQARKAKLDAEKALSEAEEASEKQLEQIDKLEQTLFELRGDIGAGTHVPPGVRILSLKQNPAQEWSDLRQSVMDRLKRENEALMKRLRELEQSGAVGGGGENQDGYVPRESWEVVSKEKVELEEVVRQKEKRLLRLQQVFTAKSAEFRETIASILGLKLAFYPNGQVRVTSVYDLSASFVFQPAPKSESGAGARMQLIAQGEGGPQELPQLMRYWVEEEQCIPGFLASVTLECWEKVKRETGESA